MKLMLSIVLCPVGCNMEGQVHQFDMAGGIFGRAPDNDWVLPDPSRYVSSHHGRIRFENNQFLLIDESTNGIFLNGASLPLGAAQETVLKNDDLLLFGDYRVQVSIEEITNITASGSLINKDVDPGVDAPSKAAPVFVDDLDKWLEPSLPANESLASPQAAINISSSPLVESVGSLDLGLPGEQLDPLALLGEANQKACSSSPASSGPLTDLLGQTPSLDQQMMKMPNVIPDDWDDLLGGNAADHSERICQESIEIAPIPSQNLGSEPAPSGPDKTTCVEAVSTSNKSVETQSALDHAVQVTNNVSQTAQEALGLSELLATPPEALQSHSNHIPFKTNLESQHVQDDASFSTPSDEPKEAELAQNITTNDGAELAKLLGLDRLSAAQQRVLNETVANTVKETVAGMMRTLRARSEIKSEFRLNMTTIQSAENNPLKFSVTPEDAIENMFAKEGKAYLSPIDAMNDGFADISDHQVALFDAMKAAYEHILGQFDPEVLSNKFEKTSSKGFLSNGKVKNWNAYLALFDEYKADNELTFKRLFGEVFADAYERRMHSLKMTRKGPSSQNVDH